MTQPATRVLCQPTVQREVCTGQKLKTTPKSRRPFLHRGCACIPFSLVSRAIVRRVCIMWLAIRLELRTDSRNCTKRDRQSSIWGGVPWTSDQGFANMSPRLDKNAVGQLRRKARRTTHKKDNGLEQSGPFGWCGTVGDPHAKCKAHSHECLNSNGHECFFQSIFSVHALFLKICSHRHANVHVYFVHIHFEPLHVTCTRRSAREHLFPPFHLHLLLFLSRTGQDRTGQGRAGQGRAGQGTAWHGMAGQDGTRDTGHGTRDGNTGHGTRDAGRDTGWDTGTGRGHGDTGHGTGQDRTGQ